MDFSQFPQSPNVNETYQGWRWDGKSWQPPAGGGGTTITGGITIPNLNFDWNAADQNALAQLRPYYQQVLDLNNGDVNRAKQAIEADYQSGKRYNTGQYTDQMTQENLTANDEQQQTLDDLNKRGVALEETKPGQQGNVPQASGQDSGIPTGLGINPTDVNVQPNAYNQPQQGLGYSDLATKGYIDPLLDKQQARRNAIQRAVQRQSDTLGTNYTQQMGDQTSKSQQYQLQLGQQMSSEANQLAEGQYNTSSGVQNFAANNALSAANSLLPGQDKGTTAPSSLATL